MTEDRFTDPSSEVRDEVTAPASGRTATTHTPPATASVADGAVVFVADGRYVQPADLTGCDISGCADAAVPDWWALVDLDTGEELPGRFCELHELAYLRHTHPTITVIA